MNSEDETDKKSVLIIEDDQSVRDGLKAMLTKAGYDVSTAATHAAASGKLASEECEPDLVMLDNFTGGHRRDRHNSGFSGEHFLKENQRILPPCIAIADSDTANTALERAGNGQIVSKIPKKVIRRALNDERSNGGPITDIILGQVSVALEPLTSRRHR